MAVTAPAHVPAGPGIAPAEGLGLALAFLAAFWFVRGVAEWLGEGERLRTEARLRSLARRGRERLALEPMLALAEASRPPEGPPSAARASLFRRGASLRERAVALAERGLSRSRWHGRVQGLLLRAQLPWRPSEFLALSGGCGALGCLAGLALPFLLSETSSAVAGALIGALGGALLPWQAASLRARKRLHAFDLQLPDTLSLLANSLRSGYSLLQACDLVAREAPEPTAGEFRRLLRETQLNVPLEEALHHLLRRIPSRDLDLVVTAIRIQKEVGGNLAEVLARIAGTIRERVRLFAYIRALTAQGRLSGWIVGLLPLALAVLIGLLQPAYIGLLASHPFGRLLVVGAIGLQAMGAWWIRALIRVEV